MLPFLQLVETVRCPPSSPPPRAAPRAGVRPGSGALGLVPALVSVVVLVVVLVVVSAVMSVVGCGGSGGAGDVRAGRDVRTEVVLGGRDAAALDGASLADTVFPGDAQPSLDRNGGNADQATPPVRDLWVPIPEVAIGPQALGGVCSGDDQCRTGLCLVHYAGGYCSALCDRDEECPDRGACFPDPEGDARVCWKRCFYDTHCRADQFCAEQAELCVPRCRPGDCKPGYRCEPTSGRCEPDFYTCEPSDELCDEQDNDCDGYVDEGCSPAPVTPGTVEVLDLGLIYAGGSGLTRDVSFDVPAGVASFTLIVFAEDDGWMTVWSMRAPSGAIIVDGNDHPSSLNRSSPAQTVYTLMVPNAPQVPLETGPYTFSLYKEGENDFVEAIVLFKRGANPSGGTLDLNLYFVGSPAGINAGNAPTDERFQSLLERFRTVYAATGIHVRQVRYFDITGADATRFGIIDATDGPGDELGPLLALSGADAQDNGLNFFFVHAIVSWSLLGVAGGIPGPPLVQGTPNSGVAVSMVDFAFWGGAMSTAEAMAHEAGHQLGLYHPSEHDGTWHDHIADTPECLAEHDMDGDGIVSTWECRGRGDDNLMFWAVSGGVVLSEGQRFVLRRNAQVE